MQQLAAPTIESIDGQIIDAAQQLLALRSITPPLKGSINHTCTSYLSTGALKVRVTIRLTNSKPKSQNANPIPPRRLKPCCRCGKLIDTRHKENFHINSRHTKRWCKSCYESLFIGGN